MDDRRKYRLEVFYCDRLSCKLTRVSCAGRWIRGELCKRGGDYSRSEWVPRDWAGFAHNCRGCPVGEKHFEETGVDVPEMAEWTFWNREGKPK